MVLLMFSNTDYAVLKSLLLQQFVDGNCNIYFTELTPIYKETCVETCFVLVNINTNAAKTFLCVFSSCASSRVDFLIFKYIEYVTF